jgi:hypothetical protein
MALATEADDFEDMRRKRACSLQFIGALVVSMAEASVIDPRVRICNRQSTRRNRVTPSLWRRAIYNGNFRLPAKTGTGYITITSSDQTASRLRALRFAGSAMAFLKIKAPNDSPAMLPTPGALPPHRARNPPGDRIYTYELVSLLAPPQWQATLLPTSN